VEVLNKKGESLSMMPFGSQGTGKKLIVELKVLQHGKKSQLTVGEALIHWTTVDKTPTIHKRG